MALRFAIRDLLWLTLVVAILRAWPISPRARREVLHYWVEPGTYKVHFSHGRGTDGAHKLQAYIYVDTLEPFHPDHIEYDD